MTGMPREAGRRMQGRVTALLAAAAFAACSSGPTAPGGPPPPPPAPPAANVTVTGGDAQTAPPGQAVETAPEVRVTNSAGQGVSGIAVEFQVVSGGGSVSNPNTTTNSQGRASAGTWTLGTQAGTQQLRAIVSGVGSVTFSATAAGSPPEPSVLQIVAGDGQTAEVGGGVPVRPRIRVLDEDDDPIAGVPVTFAVVLGGGSVTGASAVTNGSGEAEAGAWTLGTASGENGLRASVSGVSPVTFRATGTAGAPASIAPTAGDGQTATAGDDVPVPPAVRVADAFGNPVPDVAVTFAVASGGGSVSGGSQTTDASGSAAVGAWTLGGTPGTNTLTATVAGDGISGNPVGFTATGVAGGGGGGGFDIEIRYNPGSSPTGAQVAAYAAAEAKWEDVITGDLPDLAISRPAGTCTSPTAIDETVDDLVIFVTLEAIDGPGGVLGSAGPCLVRSGSYLPVMGSMRFDTADLATLEGNGLLEEVILHEMAHVLGVGTLWPTLGLLADPAASGGTDPYFTGADAIAAFDDVGGSGYAGPKVPVEAGGGPGTRDGHWRESIFDKELMTGWIDAGTNPVSLVTVESLDDLGYDVDPGEADSYGLPASPSVIPGPGAAPAAIKLEGDIERRPIEIVDEAGRRIGLIPR